MKGYHILALALLILLIFAGSASAQNNEGLDVNQTTDYSMVNVDSNFSKTNYNSLEAANDNIVAEGGSGEITVENWDDLQYYCSLDDKDYTLKLKENTNYYPTNVSDSNYQINIKNNVHIIGAEGAYIGDVSPDAGKITYTAIKVDDDIGIGVTLENITFKWIATRYQPDGVFFVMGGNANNIIRNCYFTNITTDLGHSSILHLKRGYATLSNCTFVNCTTDFGCVSIYDPKDDPTKTCTGASMNVDDCYFEGNYAKTEPGCINNCGILVVNNSTFYKNSAFWWAGAIHTHGGANTTIYDSDFFDNLAGWNGGALYTYSYLQIYGSRFIGNNCTTNNGGGAIGACKYLHAPYIHIEDTLFENNENLCWGLDELSTSGTGRGGAISLMDEGGLEVYNSIFIKNSASIGTAICAISGGLSYGSPDVKLIGNQFINHTRIGDVLDVRLATGSVAEIRDNYFLNNSIVFSKLKLTADDPINGKVTFHLDAALKNPKSYDEDILQKSKYDVYVDGVYKTTVSSTDFTLDLGKGNTAHVYVVPSISTSKSNEVFAGIAKTFIFVSQSRGNDNNDGSTRAKPVKTLNKSIELARSTENIVIMDGTFKETDLTINYNLTIVAENNAAITATGNIFTITDGDVKFENLTFKNCKEGSSTKNRIISQTNTGFLTLDSCVFESNEFRTQVEASGNLECENIVATNNKDGSIFKADSIVIKSSRFINNVATNTISKSIIMYKTNSKMTKFEMENLTFIGNTVHTGCLLPAKAKATITDCTFIENTGTNRASAICVENSGSVVVQSCKFINNTDTGKSSSVIYPTSGTVVLQDSILINNSYENTNNFVINANDAQLKKLTANNNWWGNTQDNLAKPALKVFPKTNTLPNGWDPASYWLVLNGTAINNDIELYDKVPVQFSFTQIDNEGNVTAYDGGFMPSIDLTLKAINGTCSDRKITMVNGMATTYFTLTEMSGGSLTASFNGIDSTINFNFKKSAPTMTITANNITVGNTAEIGVNLDTGVNGNVILKVGNVTQSKAIYTSTTFTISDLPAGNYTIEANYTGNDRYESVVSTAKLRVNKLPTDINISYGAVSLDSDVVFTFILENGATGTIEVYVNGIKKQTINVGQTYTITKISRGDYSLKAVYSGDSRYLASEDEVKLEVAKLTPTVTADIPEVTYGSDTIVSVSLNSNATGNLTVTVDGKTSSATVNAGKASVTLSNLNAGTNKNAVITYSGDNNYKNSTITKSFNVKKAKLDFTITSNNIKVGQDAIVQITLPARIGGTVTLLGIKNAVKNVPVTGMVTETYTDLADGTYTVTARYDGDNYETAFNSTTFNVSLWNVPQWANEGGDVKHTGKSPYDTTANGDLKWSGEVGEITGNMAIDSQGNVYVTTKEGIYSLDANGNLRWKFLSNDAGSTFAGIAISRDVIIAPKADDTIYFINQTTGERYGHANLFQGSSNFVPIVDANGNVYISGQGDANNPNLVIIPYKLWENGGTPTVIELGSSPNGAPVLINDKLVAVPCNSGLKIVDVSSKMVIATISGNTNYSYAVVGEGNIIYSFLGDSIMAINSVGTNVWTSKVTGGIGNKLTLDPEQAVYAVNAKGELYKYDILDGSESKFTDLTVTSGILVGSDSNVYFASNDFVYALDVDGNVLWKAKLDSEIVGTPIMDKNGVIYVNSLNKVYALKYTNLRDASLVITTKTINVGETESITITLNENATGLIDLTVNGNTSKEDVIDGKIVKTFDNLKAGDYKVTVKYSGDSRYSQTTKTDNFKVLKLIPQMDVNANNITCGEDAVFDVVLPSTAEGTVTVSVNGKSNSAKLNNGKASVSISGLAKGEYNYTVSYSGDSKYYSNSISKEFEVVENILNIVAIVEDTKYGNPTKFVVNLNPDASGIVSVKVDNKTASAQIIDGSATVEISGLSLGFKTAEISYSGDNRYDSAKIRKQFTITNADKANASLDASVSDINVGESAVFTVTLNSDASGIVSVSVDGVSASGAVSKGKSVINIQGLTFGTKNALITYDGDSKYKSAIISRDFKVNRIDPTIAADIKDINVGEKAVIEITFNSDASGSVNVKVEGKTITADVTNGKSKVVLSDLSSGAKSAVISYSGDGKYTAGSIDKTFNVNKLNPTITVDVDDISAGEVALFTIALNSDASGIVSLNIDGKSYSSILTGGIAKISVEGLTGGIKKAIINYTGDNKYLSKDASTSISVNKLNPQIIIKVDDISAGENAVVNVESSVKDLKITLNVADKTYNLAVKDGKASIEVSGLNVGSYNAVVLFNGDENYLKAENSTAFKVIKKEIHVTNDTTPADKLNPRIIIKVGDISAGENAVVNVESSVKDARITLNVADKNYDFVLKDGKASLEIPDLSVGKYKASVVFNGDEKYLKAENSTAFNVIKKEIPVTDDIIPESSDQSKYSINLPSDATGTLTVTVDGKNYTQNVVNGKATVTIPQLIKGNHNIVITYSGDKKYSPIIKSKVIYVNNVIATHFDTAEGVQFKVYAVDFKVGERGKSLSFKLLDSNGNPVSGVSVKLTYKTNVFNRTTNAEGVVSFGISTQFAGNYKASIIYGGSDKYGSTTTSFSIKVNKKPLTITAKAKTFKAKVKTKKYTITLKTKKCSSKNGKIYLKSGIKLTLKIKGKTYTAKINKKGKATFKITKLTKKGKYTAVIKFKGDKTYKAVTKKVKITIK